MSAEATMLNYDPWATSSRDDPWATFKQLRDHAPVYHNPERDIWAISRFEDVRAVSRDWESFSSAKGVTIIMDPDTGETSASLIGPGDFLEMDPPLHDELRKTVRHVFAPRAVAELEAAIRGIANDLLDDMEGKPDADLARDFAVQIPGRVMTHMFGLPQADFPQLSEWFHKVTDPPPGGGVGLHPEAIESMGKMWVYLAGALEERRGGDATDLLGEVTRARIDGEPLGDQEVGMCFLLYAAGEDTTQNLISTAIHSLDGHPDQRAWLQDDLTRLPQAIEELLRHDGPFLHLARVTTKDVTLHDVTIPADARVLLLYASANRDERQYESPEILDLQRKKVHHLGFGEGIHHCLGGSLARLEAKVALQCLFERYPGFALTQPGQRCEKLFLRGFVKLPVNLGGK